MQADGIRKLSGRTLTGFTVPGLVMSCLGVCLPVWGHHLRADFALIAGYFLAMNAGLAGSSALSARILARRGPALLLSLSCAIAAVALIYLSFVPPPYSVWWRVCGFAVLGLAAGLLNSALFCALSTQYRAAPARTVNFGGLYFGAGSLATALLAAAIIPFYTVQSILLLIAVTPALFAVWFFRRRHTVAYAEYPRFRQTQLSLRSPETFLYTLILFFQFGNEWCLAGWLPMFLILRLGVSPASSLRMLGLYWGALLAGRFVADFLIDRGNHSRMLAVSVTSALFGCFVLAFTDNLFGAGMGLLLSGFGFSVIYPLIVQDIGNRYPDYHPGLFNGIFSIGLTGAMIVPALVGYVAEAVGIRAAVLFPMAGACAVAVLLVILWLRSLAPRMPSSGEVR